MSGETPPSGVIGRLVAGLRSAARGAARLDHLQRRHTVRPGGLRALMRTVLLAACPLVLVIVAGLAVDALPDHSIISIGALTAVVATSLAVSGLVGRYRGVHDMIAPTAVVRA